MEGNKTYNILAYIGILWLVGLLSAKDQPDVRFHVNQGIILSIATLFVWIPVLGQILGIGIIVLAIMGIIAANKGEQKELPIIGKIKILK
jgi:uncharacterized membrane protein